MKTSRSQLNLSKLLYSLNPFKKGKMLRSIVTLKCPRCQEGSLFEVRNPYRFKYLDIMPHYCPVCGEDFQREVGFYYGAMMISHALTTLIAVVVHFIVFQFYGWEIAPNVIPLVTILIVFFPVIFRTSRAVWINMFSKYDPNAIENKIKHEFPVIKKNGSVISSKKTS